MTSTKSTKLTDAQLHALGCIEKTPAISRFELQQRGVTLATLEALTKRGYIAKRANPNSWMGHYTLTSEGQAALNAHLSTTLPGMGDFFRALARYAKQQQIEQQGLAGLAEFFEVLPAALVRQTLRIDNTIRVQAEPRRGGAWICIDFFSGIAATWDNGRVSIRTVGTTLAPREAQEMMREMECALDWMNEIQAMMAAAS